MARRPGWVRAVFHEHELEAMTKAIQAAEAGTSGEIRVHLERRVPKGKDGRPIEALARARDLFVRLGLARTAQRNGVLVYLALDDRRLAIVGDEGVHARVGDRYWEGVRDLMVERLRAGRSAEAVIAAVGEVGRVLTEHFPHRPDDVNELPDDVSTG